MALRHTERDWLAEHFITRDQAKQGFPAFREAQEEADRRNQRDTEKRPLRPYKCGYCDAFHVGHSNPKRRRRRR